MKKLLFTLVLGTWSLCTFAATYYASPTGTGNGTSYSSPASWSTALSAIAGGDTLYLLSGEYLFSSKQTIGTSKNGFSQNKRTFIGAFPGEKPILDFSAQPYGSEVTGSNNVGISVSANTMYIHIKGLTIRYAGKNGLINYGSYNLIENLDVYGCGDTGIQMKNGGNNTILNCDSHDNFDYKTMSGSTANFGGNADGFADKQFTGAGNHYIGCRAWGNSDDGWDFFQRVSSSNTVIENCVCYQNGPAYYDMSQNPRALTTDKAWFDSKVGTQMTDRYGNTITITLEKFPCQGNGNGFKMGGQYTEHKILIHHCLAVANRERGFDQNNNDGTMWVYNNTGYANGYNFGFTTAYGTNYMRNNISFSGKNADQPKSKTVAANDYNTWNSGFACSAADFQSLDTTQILVSRQADHSLPEGTCLRLQATSALIDKGVDVNLTYNGDAPDLGCYEAPGEEHRPDTIPEDTVPAVQPEGTHAVAFVTLPGCDEDKALLRYLRQNDSLWIVETEATDATTDYSAYEVIVLGSKPNSGAPGFTPLKNYDKPMVLLKPFLLKAGVWGWGTALNTQDLSVSVTAPEHPLFEGLTITNGEIQLFSQCNTNAVTAISAWTLPEGEPQVLASPVSNSEAASIAILPQGMIMIGVSEYSTAHLTTDGMRLIENAICLQLGIENNHPSGFTNYKSQITNHKYIQNGQLLIQTGDAVYDITGRRISR
ncbi:MAG: right-handed parallel beta-helix repeat-containing protein [Paludibacteraceae bacterium]|nr:right-handed parallel beta-helix repeat-containing protein [Paludibacteraceae bacterium]